MELHKIFLSRLSSSCWFSLTWLMVAESFLNLKNSIYYLWYKFSQWNLYKFGKTRLEKNNGRESQLLIINYIDLRTRRTVSTISTHWSLQNMTHQLCKWLDDQIRSTLVIDTLWHFVIAVSYSWLLDIWSGNCKITKSALNCNLYHVKSYKPSSNM